MIEMTEIIAYLQNPFAQYSLFAVLVAVPTIRILERTGLKTAWVLLIGIPMVGFLLCAAVVAFSKWPAFTVQAKENEG